MLLLSELTVPSYHSLKLIDCLELLCLFLMGLLRLLQCRCCLQDLSLVGSGLKELRFVCSCRCHSMLLQQPVMDSMLGRR